MVYKDPDCPHSEAPQRGRVFKNLPEKVLLWPLCITWRLRLEAWTTSAGATPGPECNTDLSESFRSGLFFIHCNCQADFQSQTPSPLTFLRPGFSGIQLYLTVLSPELSLGVSLRVTPAATIGRSSRERGERRRSSTAPSPPLPLINEFVLSVRPASCQPRSLLIKLALATVLNTDWWMSVANEGLRWLLCPLSQFSGSEGKPRPDCYWHVLSAGWWPSLVPLGGFVSFGALPKQIYSHVWIKLDLKRSFQSFFTWIQMENREVIFVNILNLTAERIHVLPGAEPHESFHVFTKRLRSKISRLFCGRMHRAQGFMGDEANGLRLGWGLQLETSYKYK